MDAAEIAIASKADRIDIPFAIETFAYFASNFTAEGSKYYHDFSISKGTGKAPKLLGSVSETTSDMQLTFSGITATGFRAWIDSNRANAVITVVALIPK